MSNPRSRPEGPPPAGADVEDFQRNPSDVIGARFSIVQAIVVHRGRMREWASEHAINASERAPALVGCGRRLDLQEL